MKELKKLSKQKGKKMLYRTLSIVQAGLILFKLAGIGDIQYWSWFKVISVNLYFCSIPLIWALSITAYAIVKESFKQTKR